MAEITLFHYIPKKTIIHQMDGRLKLVCMILFTMAAGFARNLYDLAILTSVLFMIYMAAGLSVKRFMIELKYFFILAGIIIGAHSFTVPGTAIPGFPIQGITWEGLNSGLLLSWRLIVMIFIGAIMTGTTSLLQFKNAVEWFLRPLPFIPEARVATMFSLTFVLIPLILDQISEMMDAQKSRCIDGRKDPVTRILFLVRPLLFHAFMRAEEIVQAMESRCYSEIRTKPKFKSTLNDWLVLAFSIFICFIIWVD